MKAGTLVAWAALGLVSVALAWILFIGLPRWYAGTPVVDPGGEPPAATNESGPSLPSIAARLFYVGEGGTALTPVERDVPFEESAVEQARAIVAAQIEPVEPPLVSAIPEGTTLRAFFLTPAGEAYVDLGREATDQHPGGVTGELLTIYAIVHALTENLPAVSSVQLLINGREVDTLAGHVNLRRPLSRNLAWVQ